MTRDTKLYLAIGALGILFILLAILLPQPARAETGVASYYCCEHHGRLTASREPFNEHAMTAAHPSLPFGTKVRVTHLKSGRSVVVRVNDRGPAKRLHRIIDLSRAAARKLGMEKAGLARVTVVVVR